MEYMEDSIWFSMMEDGQFGLVWLKRPPQNFEKKTSWGDRPWPSMTFPHGRSGVPPSAPRTSKEMWRCGCSPKTYGSSKCGIVEKKTMQFGEPWRLVHTDCWNTKKIYVYIYHIATFHMYLPRTWCHMHAWIHWHLESPSIAYVCLYVL